MYFVTKTPQDVDESKPLLRWARYVRNLVRVEPRRLAPRLHVRRRDAEGRGLHSSTFSAQRKAFCMIGGACRGCLGDDWVVFRWC